VTPPASPYCRVPAATRKTLAAAKRLVARAGCRLGVVRKAHSRRVKRGYVVAQSVRAGARVRRGARISLVVSLGARR
jgi:beta-lactam-binding protein with PASTA domain